MACKCYSFQSSQASTNAILRVPFLIEMILKIRNIAIGYDLSCGENIVSGATPLPEKTANAFVGSLLRGCEANLVPQDGSEVSELGCSLRVVCKIVIYYLGLPQRF